MYFPHFIMTKGGLTLWQMGHYHYEITRNSDKFQLVQTVMDSCSKAVEILESITH